jgi:outer membrane protein OmpA-like peptidoglycan-associated protein
MKRYVAGVAVLSLLVSGCASEGSASGKRGMTNTETGAAIGTVGGAEGSATGKRGTTNVETGAAIGTAGGAEGSASGKRGMTNTETGAVIGAGGGAGVGAVAYKKNRTAGAIVGAVGGGLAGGAIGAYMGSQKKDLERSLRKEIESHSTRVDRMPHDVVRITMTSQTAFDTNSAAIKPGFYSSMDKVADVVIRYGKTTLTIEGHTDNKGTSEHNQKLSQGRALSIAHYLESKDVNPVRLATLGKGEGEPIASNDTESGRQANRRVEIYVQPVRAK